jgi:hypothetical protein
MRPKQYAVTVTATDVAGLTTHKPSPSPINEVNDAPSQLKLTVVWMLMKMIQGCRWRYLDC